MSDQDQQATPSKGGRTPVVPKSAEEADASGGSRPSSSSFWIVGPWKDLLLFVGTPLLIIPFILGLERLWNTKTIYMFVAAFGAMGHHLPGMMRAYGDRALFQRFKVRFIAAPVFLLVVCIWFALNDPSPVVLLTFLWGVWHGLMQTHGFLRIYDAKVGSTARSTALLDQGMCFFWFGMGVFFSASRTRYILEFFYKSGGPAVSPEVITATQWIWGGLTAAVTAAWAANLMIQWKRGRPPSPVKILLLATSVGFWLYANVVVTNLILGIILFEIFHDVQYLSIVWLYNRKRVDKDPKVGGFTRFLFRNSGALMGLYVGLVLAYGSISLVKDGLEMPMVKAVLGGIVTASTLLHFYFDGFIWKVREASTREGLGIKGGEDIAYQGRRIPSWATHLAKWALFVVPLAAFAWAQAQNTRNETHRLGDIVSSMPDQWDTWFDLGIARTRKGDLEGSIEANRRALELSDGATEEERHRIRRNLAWNLIDLGRRQLREGRTDEAATLLQEAHQMNPGFTQILNQQGMEAWRAGQMGEAALWYRAGLLMEPDHAQLLYNLALARMQQGKATEALDLAQRARERNPGLPDIDRLIATLEEQASGP